jgi:hypothetical protein
MAITIPLSKPLKTHDGEVTSLTLRDFSAIDIVNGRVSPVKIVVNEDKTQTIDIRYDVAMAYLSKLTGVDDILLGALSGADFQKAVNAVIELFNSSGE